MTIFVSLILGAFVRSCVLAGLCALVVWLLSGRPAAIRFTLWKYTLLALFALPILMSLTPPLPKAAAQSLTHLEVTHFPVALVNAVSQPRPITLPAHPLSPTSLFLALLLLVTLCLLARLMFNLLQLQRLAPKATRFLNHNFNKLPTICGSEAALATNPASLFCKA